MTAAILWFALGAGFSPAVGWWLGRRRRKKLRQSTGKFHYVKLDAPPEEKRLDDAQFQALRGRNKAPF